MSEKGNSFTVLNSDLKKRNNDSYYQLTPESQKKNASSHCDVCNKSFETSRGTQP